MTYIVESMEIKSHPDFCSEEVATSNHLIQFHFEWWDRELGMYCRSKRRSRVDALYSHWVKLNACPNVSEIVLNFTDKFDRERVVFYPFDADYLQF